MLEPFPVGVEDINNDLFEIHPEHKRRHISIFGKSGVGKTTLLQNMITWDIRQGVGVTVIDPHGGLIHDILKAIPRSRTNDVIFFNPQDPKRVPAINILESVTEDQKPLVVSSIISILKNIWAENWGPRTEYILSNAAFALLEQSEPQTLLAVPKLLTDSKFRERIIENTTDPAVLGFFDIYDNHWNARFREEAISPLLNKANKFITNSLLRDVIGQKKSSFDFRTMMDKGQILLCDLSKGALGGDVSSLLGSLIVTKLSLAALSRQDMPEEKRKLHVLYADEVQNFIYGVDFSTILSEARKYRLALCIATQTLTQLPKDSLASVFGNVGTLISFRVSGDDAETLQTEFATKLPARLLQDLPDYYLYIRSLLVEGSNPSRPHEPKLVKAVRPLEGFGDRNTERIIRASHERFTRPRAEVEAKLTKFLAS